MPYFFYLICVDAAMVRTLPSGVAIQSKWTQASRVCSTTPSSERIPGFHCFFEQPDLAVRAYLQSRDLHNLIRAFIKAYLALRLFREWI